MEVYQVIYVEKNEGNAEKGEKLKENTTWLFPQAIAFK